MAGPAQPTTTERRPVEFAAAPLSRLWVAVCVALGGAILAACLALGFGEVVLSLKRLVLEAIVNPRIS